MVLCIYNSGKPAGWKYFPQCSEKSVIRQELRPSQQREQANNGTGFEKNYTQSYRDIILYYITY
jgi:hypothetical protein